MPSFGGSSPAGNTTVTQVNPTQQAQLPFLQGGWQYAGQVRDNGLDPLQAIRYYPGQTMANFNPAMEQAYGGMINAGNIGTDVSGRALWSGLDNATGGMRQSPANDLYMGIYNGANAPFAQVSGLNDAAARALSATQGQSQGLYNIGGNSYNFVAPYSQGLYNIGGNAYNQVSPYAQDLSSISRGAYGSVSPYTGGLYDMAGSTVPGATQYMPGSERSALYGVSSGAFDPNAGTDELSKAATGAYVGSNPFLSSAIATAQDPLLRAYSSTIAPGIDSTFEGSGRYGSGAWMQSQRQAAQDLEKQLGNISGTMSSQAYSQERQLQDAAAQQLAAIRNQQTQIAQQGYGAAGQLGLGMGTLDVNARNAAIQALTSGAGATNTAGNLAANASGTAGQLVNQAGNVGTGALQAGAGAVNTAGQVGTGALDASGRLVGTGEQLSQQALASQADILNRITQNQLSAAGGVQQGWNYGNLATTNALSQIPGLLQSVYGAPQQILAGGQGYTAMDQQRIQDEMNRYYGTQNAPWETLTRYMNAIGQPTQGSSSTTQPYFQNSTANALGALSGGVQGLGALNNLTGGGLGSLFGLGASAIPGASAAASAGMGALFPGAAASALPAYAAAAGGAETLASAAAFAPAISSDRRLKTDVARVGTLDNGLAVYRYRYIGDSRFQIGLMADEVEQLHPDAVVTGPDGYQRVYYRAATEMPAWT